MLCFITLLLIIPRISTAQYYYSYDKQILLNIDSTKVTIKFRSDLDETSISNIIGQNKRINNILDEYQTMDDFIVCSLSISQDYFTFIDSLKSINGIYLVEPFYKNSSGFAQLEGEKFVVAFDEHISLFEIDSINNIYHVDLDKQILPTNVFLINNTDLSDYNILDISNVYNNLSAVRYAHPDFIAHLEQNSYKLYDYYTDFQYHIKNVIGEFNNASVWDFAGLNDTLIVAVLDDGIDNHEDLPQDRIIQGFDYCDNDPDPRPDSDNGFHGMACAGIIAATHTLDSAIGELSSSGIISLNEHVKILNNKIFPDAPWDPAITSARLALAIYNAVIYNDSKTAIISNSWNYTDPLHPNVEEIDEALLLAYTIGRPIYNEYGILLGWRGCPVFFSAGNKDGAGILYTAPR